MLAKVGWALTLTGAVLFGYGIYEAGKIEGWWQ